MPATLLCPQSRTARPCRRNYKRGYWSGRRRQVAKCDDECDRKRERAGSENHQGARAFSDRRCGGQADLAGAAQYHGQMGSCHQALEGSDEPVRHPLRRPLHQAGRLMPVDHCPAALRPLQSATPPSGVATPPGPHQHSHTKIRIPPWLSGGIARRLSWRRLLPSLQDPTERLPLSSLL